MISYLVQYKTKGGLGNDYVRRSKINKQIVCPWWGVSTGYTKTLYPTYLQGKTYVAISELIVAGLLLFFMPSYESGHLLLQGTLLGCSADDLAVAQAQLVGLSLPQHLLKASQGHIEHQHLRGIPSAAKQKDTTYMIYTYTILYVRNVCRCHVVRDTGSKGKIKTYFMSVTMGSRDRACVWKIK